MPRMLAWALSSWRFAMTTSLRRVGSRSSTRGEAAPPAAAPRAGAAGGAPAPRARDRRCVRDRGDGRRVDEHVVGVGAKSAEDLAQGLPRLLAGIDSDDGRGVPAGQETELAAPRRRRVLTRRPVRLERRRQAAVALVLRPAEASGERRVAQVEVHGDEALAAGGERACQPAERRGLAAAGDRARHSDDEPSVVRVLALGMAVRGEAPAGVARRWPPGGLLLRARLRVA